MDTKSSETALKLKIKDKAENEGWTEACLFPLAVEVSNFSLLQTDWLDKFCFFLFRTYVVDRQVNISISTCSQTSLDLSHQEDPGYVLSLSLYPPLFHSHVPSHTLIWPKLSLSNHKYNRDKWLTFFVYVVPWLVYSLGEAVTRQKMLKRRQNRTGRERNLRIPKKIIQSKK